MENKRIIQNRNHYFAVAMCACLIVFAGSFIVFLKYIPNFLVKSNNQLSQIVAIALILAGAFGNIIDSVFYGLVFDDSHNHLATLFSDKPYAKVFHGKVVDMLYFPIFEAHFPQWMPFWGGKEFKFFNAIFNIADMAISTGVGILIVFNKKAFHRN